MSNSYHLIPADQAGDTSPTGDQGVQNPTALTNNALGFLEVFEGLQPPQFTSITPYPDSKGLATVGIGWLLTGDSFNAGLFLQEIGLAKNDPKYAAMVAVFNRAHG